MSVGKVCGVPAGAIGVKLGASLVDREQVNTGTGPGSSLVVPQPVVRWVGDHCPLMAWVGAESS